MRTGSEVEVNNFSELADYMQSVPGLLIPVHDYIGITYTGNNATTIVYKTGGSGGTTVATLTIAYDGNNNITSITKT